jgi:uncharacterized protein
MSEATFNGTAVITGASSGIGALYADRLAKRKHDLILIARRKDRLDALAARLQAENGINVEVIAADLTNPGDLRRVEERISQNPKVSILVNNAGMANWAKLQKADADALDQVIKLNITATTRLTHAVLPGLLSRGSGAIVNVASVLAFMTIPDSSASAAAKAYVVAFSQGLQKEVEGTGVLVQVLVPSATDGTGFWDVAGFAVTNFPPQIVMTAENVVEAALRGLDRKEQFVFPGLADAADWDNFNAARQKFAGAIASGKPAARYAA